MINLNNLWENKEKVISRCKDKQACVTEFTKLIKAENETDFKQVILNNFGWVNCNQIIDEPKFVDAWGFCDGLALVKLDEKYGYIKTNGSYLIEPKFVDARNFYEGSARVKVGKHWGYIKPDGSYIVKPKFDEAWSFQDGLARVEIDGVEYQINTKGERI